MHSRSLSVLTTALVLGALAPSHRAIACDDASQGPTRQAEPPSFTATTLRDNVTTLSGPVGFGNVLVLNGKKGAFVIDNAYAAGTEALQASLATLAPKGVKYMALTHWHPDHVAANATFKAAGATLIAHKNTRARMSTQQTVEFFGATIPAYPDEALPTSTFSKSAKLSYAGETIEMRHYPAAHTDSDVVFFLKKANVVHLGDIHIAHAYPFVDIPNGGNMLAQIAAYEDIVRRIDNETIIVPGHGPNETAADICEYLAMLQDTKRIVEEQMAAGKSLEEIQATGFPQYASYGFGPIPATAYIGFLYAALSAR